MKARKNIIIQGFPSLPFVKCLSGFAEVPYQVPPWSLLDAPRMPKNKSKEAYLVRALKVHLYRKVLVSRASKRGGFKRGRFPIWTCPSFFVLFCPFWDFPDFSGIFPICSGMVRGFSRLVLFLFLGLLRAPTGNSPERVRDRIWTFPKKVGNTRVWKPPGLASLNCCEVLPRVRRGTVPGTAPFPPENALKTYLSRTKKRGF